MGDTLFIAVIFLSIWAGIYAILITYKLHKKYRLSYLSTYLYFQIFINVFGVYGILGQAIAKKILQQQESSFQILESFGHFFSFLGLPFLIFAWYMFIRLCREIIEKKLSRTFNLSYFFSLAFIFLSYGVVIVLSNLLDFGDEQYAFFSSAIIYLYVTLEILVLIIALSQIFVNARKIQNEKKQKAVLTFAYLILIIFSAGITLFLLANKNIILGAIYLLLFFSGNIPPVLYWRAYLKKYFIAPVLQKIGPMTMKQFLEEHKISKREEEVIRQSCEGKTNKEISETLFISLQTVKDHVYSIYQKTDVKNRVQLINLIQSYREEGEKNS
jgi:DNA-binding CsgD family transcriptional regulator